MYFIVSLVYGTYLFKDGKNQVLWASSMCAYFSIVFLHYLTLLTFTGAFNLWLTGMYLLSFLLFAPAFIVTYDYFPGTPITRRLYEIAFSNWLFWATLVVLVALCYVPVVTLLKMQDLLFPRMVDLIREVDM
jgi:hypothetical protein